MDAEQRILDRARANLLAAGVPVRDEDLEALREAGLLARVTAFERYLEQFDGDGVPAYLDRNLIAEPDLSAEASAPVLAARKNSEGSSGSSANDEYRYASIGEIAARLSRREVSSLDLVRETFERITERDPVLNAFQAVLSERAFAAARRADSERAAGIDLGPLHGVPLATKDLTAKRGTITTAGSALLAGNVTDYDATVVERLEAAGAIIVGKMRMPEFAMSPGSNNEHYGPTRNPWNFEHDTGGSSSGSGAVVADGLAYGALGTDTGGSIRMPAALCGIVGLKPTFGLVSLYGVVPAPWSVDTIGPMTRTVEDAGLMLNAIAGHDPQDPRTRMNREVNFTSDLNGGVRGLRVGVLKDDGTEGPLGSDEALASWRQALEILKSQGAELIDVSLPEMQGLRSIASPLIMQEVAAIHEAWLARHYDVYSTFFRRRLLSSYAFSPTTFVRASQARTMLCRHAARLWESVDVLTTPAIPHDAPPLGDPAPTNITFTAPFNMLGWPALVVPVSLSQKRLPLAIQIVGRSFDERTLLRVGAAIEYGRGALR